MPYLRGWHTGRLELSKDRLLEIEIEMPRTTESIDCIIRGELGQEWLGISVIDLITTPANTRADGSEYRLGLQMKYLTHALDGYRDHLGDCPLSSRVHNPYGRLTRSGEDDRKAISSDDCEWQVWAIGDEGIPWCSTHLVRVIGFGEDHDLIAVNLPERHKIIGIEANRPSEAYTVVMYTRAVISAPETQIQ